MDREASANDAERSKGPVPSESDVQAYTAGPEAVCVEMLALSCQTVKQNQEPLCDDQQFPQPPTADTAPVHDCITPMPQPSTADGAPPDCFTVPVDEQQPPPVPVRASSFIAPASPTIEVPGNAPCARSVSAHLPGQALPPQTHDGQQMDYQLVMPLQTYAQNHTNEASPVYPPAHHQLQAGPPQQQQEQAPQQTTLVQILMLALTIGWAVVLVTGELKPVRGVLPLLFVFVYFWYTVEWWSSSTDKFLWNQKQESNLFHYVEALRRTKPSLELFVNCWHNEQRTQKVHRTDGREPYSFTKWSDDSAPLPVLDGRALTKLYLTKTYCFQDGAARDQYNRTLAEFKRETPKDDCMDFATIFTVNGFQEHTLCHLSDGGPPGWVTSRCFALASWFCCSLPFRMALDYAVVTRNHSIKKRIGM